MWEVAKMSLVKSVTLILAVIVMSTLLGGCGRRHTLPAVDIDAHAPKLRYGMMEAEVIAAMGREPTFAMDLPGEYSHVRKVSYLDSKNRYRMLDLTFHHGKLTAAKFEVEDTALMTSEPFRTERRIDLPGDPDLAPKTPPTGTLPPGLAN